VGKGKVRSPILTERPVPRPEASLLAAAQLFTHHRLCPYANIHHPSFQRPMTAVVP
jgi:hypothetical protein